MEASTRLLWGRAHDAAAAPAYWPWVQAIRSHAGAADAETLRSELGAGAPEVARIVSELRERLPHLPEPGRRRREAGARPARAIARRSHPLDSSDGATRIGAVPVPINPRYRAEDFRFFVQDSDARVIVVDDEYLPLLETALGEMRTTVQVIATGSAPGADHQLAGLLAAADAELAPVDTHRDDMAFWLYSSGSTGHPKGVVHLHRNVPYTCDTYARHILDIRESDVVYGRVLYHAYGLGNTLTFPFSVGATTVLDSSRPSPAGVLEAVRRYRPTLLCLVPTLYNAILNHPDSDGADLSSVRRCISAAEPLPPVTAAASRVGIDQTGR